MIAYKFWCKRLTIFLLITLGPTACFFSEDCDKVSPYFSIQGLKISNVTYGGQDPNPWRIIDNNETVKYDSFSLAINFDKAYHSKVNYSGGQNLYALTCKQSGYAGSQTGVETLYLITLQDYNSSYLKDDTLNNIISTNYSIYQDNLYDFFPLETFLQDNQDNIRNDMLQIKITEPPSTENEFNFKLIFTLKNGDTFVAISDKVRLTK